MRCGIPPSPALAPTEGTGRGWAGRGNAAPAYLALSTRNTAASPRHICRAGQGRHRLRQGPQPLCPARRGAGAAPLPAPTSPWLLPACPAFPGRAAWRRPPGRGGEERGGKGRMLRPPWGEAAAAAAAGVAVLSGTEDAAAVVAAAAGGGAGSDAVLRGGAVAAQRPHHAPADRSVTARLPAASGRGPRRQLPACAAVPPPLGIASPPGGTAPRLALGLRLTARPVPAAPCPLSVPGPGSPRIPPCRGSGGSRRTLHRRRRDGGLGAPAPGPPQPLPARRARRERRGPG